MTYFLNYFCILKTFSICCMAHIHLETIMKTLSNIITYLVMNSCHTRFILSTIFSLANFLVSMFYGDGFDKLYLKMLMKCTRMATRAMRLFHTPARGWLEVARAARGGPTLGGETNSGAGRSRSLALSSVSASQWKLSALRSPLRQGGVCLATESGRPGWLQCLGHISMEMLPRRPPARGRGQPSGRAHCRGWAKIDLASWITVSGQRVDRGRGTGLWTGGGALCQVRSIRSTALPRSPVESNRYLCVLIGQIHGETCHWQGGSILVSQLSSVWVKNRKSS